jgi:hypothetical protein
MKMVKTSVLLSKYKEIDRPLSNDELKDMRKKLYDDLKISEITTLHKKCKHRYHVESNGKRETEIKNNKINNNCSVCWKVKNMPEELTDLCYDMVDAYMMKFYNEDKEGFCYTYNMYDLENVFYTWLYRE